MRKVRIRVWPEIRVFFIELIQIITSAGFSGAASQLAYSLILSFIPIVMAVISVAGRFELPVESIFKMMSLILPPQSYNAVESVLNEAIAAKRMTSFSIFSALSFIAIGCRGFMRVSSVADGTKDTRGFVSYWLSSYLFAAIIVISLLLCLLLVVFGGIITNVITDFFKIHSSWVFAAARYIVFIGFAGSVFTFMYAWSNEKKKKLSQTAPGGFIAASLYVLFSSLFGYYVQNFANYGILFGSLGGIFILLIWLYYSCYVLVLGLCINAVFAKLNKNKPPKQKALRLLKLRRLENRKR